MSLGFVLVFFKDIMISPSLTGSLFLDTFKALFPLLLVMGGCAPEMCLYGTRLELELNILRRIIKHLCCVVLCFFHSANCEPETLLDQSARAEVWPAC